MASLDRGDRQLGQDDRALRTVGSTGGQTQHLGLEPGELLFVTQGLEGREVNIEPGGFQRVSLLVDQPQCLLPQLQGEGVLTGPDRTVAGSLEQPDPVGIGPAARRGDAGPEPAGPVQVLALLGPGEQVGVNEGSRRAVQPGGTSVSGEVAP